MFYPRIILCVFLLCTVYQSSASDCAVGYAHLKSGKYEQAYKEFRTLAERGYPVYMNVVADMHRKGQGVPASNKLAHVWYSLSAAQGNEKGISGKSQMSDHLSKQQLSDSSNIAKDYAKEYLEPYVVKWSLD
jgi:TPR repeat protein